MILLLLVGLIYQTTATLVTINTTLGLVEGYNLNGVNRFLGIPYAQPPIGNLRFKPPVAKESWNNVLYANEYGNCCAQKSYGDEDCLSLNIFAPPLNHSSNLVPVMVFIHGGVFVKGCSSKLGLQGDYYANTTNTIMVTINYRLGVLGFLYTGDGDNYIQGNIGLMDQMMALHWIKSNIRYFGGDPARVTILGQSAGAMSVAAHVTSSYSYDNDYFQRAIVESDPFTMQFYTKSEAVEDAETFSNIVGCSLDDIACYQALPISTIIAAEWKTYEIPWEPSDALYALPYQPMIDETIITDQPLTLFNSGDFLRVPIIFGNVQNESTEFVYTILNSGYFNASDFTWYEYETFVGVFFAEIFDQVLDQYPAPSEGNSATVTEQLATDYIFMCPTRNAALGASQYVEEVYLYNFRHHPTTDPFDRYPAACEKPGIVCHSSELSFVFHSINFAPGFSWTSAEWKLSSSMMQAWANFAHGLAPWDRLNSTSLHSMDFNLPSPQVVSAYNSKRCDFWDSMGYDY